jgi:hypothetical protein
MSTNYNPEIVANDLEILLDAGDAKSYPGSGTAWSDMSGNEKDYNITFDTGGGFSSDYGGYIYFGSGTTGSGAFYADANYSIFNDATSTATMSFWIRRKATSTNGSDLWSMDRGDDNGARISRTSAGSASGTVNFYTRSQNDNLASTTALSDNIWYNVVCTLASTQKKIYLNGVLDGSQTVVATTISRSGSNEDSLGDLGSNASDGYQFKGDFASVIFYRRALSAAEVKQNFNAHRSRFRL